MTDWHVIAGNSTFTHALAAASGFLANWMLSFIKHAPPPRKDALWYGAAFDATQDTVKNNERIGQRRELSSTFVATTSADGKTSSVQSTAAPAPETVESSTKLA